MKNLGMENDMKSKEEAIRGAKVEDGIKRQRNLSKYIIHMHKIWPSVLCTINM